MQCFYSNEKLTTHQLLSIPFFEGLRKDVLEKFAGVLKIYKYKAGARIFKEGDEAKEMFFILEGTAKIVKRNYRGTEKVLGEISNPQFFGEMALIDRGTRSTSVIAATNLNVAVLSWEILNEEFAAYNPELALYTYKKIAQTLSLRLRKANALCAHNVQ